MAANFWIVLALAVLLIGLYVFGQISERQDREMRELIFQRTHPDEGIQHEWRE